MKKNILVGSLITLAVLSVSCLTQSVFAKTMKGDIQAIRIPQGTVLNVDLLDGLSTGVAGVGDEFSAMLKEDKIVANQIEHVRVIGGIIWDIRQYECTFFGFWFKQFVILVP